MVFMAVEKLLFYIRRREEDIFFFYGYTVYPS